MRAGIGREEVPDRVGDECRDSAVTENFDL
jgi:hypothetical protein